MGAPVRQITESIGDGVQHVPQERVQNSVGERRRLSLGVRFLDEVVDMPVIVHVVFFVRKTVEVPQLQFLEVVDVFFVQFIDGVSLWSCRDVGCFQFLERSLTCPLCSTTGAWGCQCRKLWNPQLQC